MSSFIDFYTQVGGKLLSQHNKQNGDRSVKISQLAVLHQPNGNSSCGYYAMYNCAQLLGACQGLASGDKSAAEAHVRAMYDQATYDAYETHSKARLLQHVPADNAKYPWTEADISTGSLERAHLAKLLEGEDEAHATLRCLPSPSCSSLSCVHSRLSQPSSTSIDQRSLPTATHVGQQRS